MLLKNFVPIIISMVPIFLIAQNTKEEITETFFLKYKENTDDALDYLFSTNKWAERNKDGINKLKFQIKESANVMGEYLGFEQIGEKSLGSSFKVQVFLVKYERQPLRFVFDYYKPKDTWVIYNFSFDENLDDDLKEFMKYEYLYRH